MLCFRQGLLGALVLAAFSCAVVRGNAAVITDQYDASTFLTGKTITATSALSDSVLGHGDNSVAPSGLGDNTILAFIRNGQGAFPGWGASLVQIASGNCADSPAACTPISGNGASYSGPAASIFAIHIGGPSPQDILGLKFVQAITSFSISGFSNGVSFIRAYGLETPPGGGGEVPLPGAVWLMGTVLAGGAGFGAWRRRRQAAAQA